MENVKTVKKTEYISLATLAIFIFLYPVMPHYLRVDIANSVKDIGAILVLGISIVAFHKIENGISSRWLFKIVMFYYAVFCALLVYHDDIWYIKYLILIPVLYILAVSVINSERRFFFILDGVIITAFVASLLGIIEEITRVNVFGLLNNVGATLNYNDDRFGFLRIIGFTSHANTYCAYCMIALFLIIYRWCNTENKRYRIGLIIMGLSILLNVFFTMSRSTWICIFVGVMLNLFMIMGWKKFLKFILIVSAAGIVVCAILALVSESFRRIIDIAIKSVLVLFDDSYVDYLHSVGLTDNAKGIGNRFDLYGWVDYELQGFKAFGKGYTAAFRHRVVFEGGGGFIKKSIEVEWMKTYWRFGFVGLFTKIVYFIANVACAVKEIVVRKREGETRFTFAKEVLIINICYIMYFFVMMRNEEGYLMLVVTGLFLAYLGIRADKDEAAVKTLNEKYVRIVKGVVDVASILIFSLLVVISFSATTTFGIKWDDTVFILIRIVLVAIVIARLTFLRESFTKSDIIAAVLSICLVVSYFSNGWSTLSYGSFAIETALLIICMKSIDRKLILKIFLVVSNIFMMLTITHALLGNINNLIYRQESHYYTPRMSFGIVYPTDFAAHLFFIAAVYLWLRYSDKVITVKKLIVDMLLLIGTCLFCYHFCHARITCGCIALFGAFLVLGAVKKYIPHKLKNIGGYMLSFVMPVAALGIVILSLLYDGDNPLFVRLNSMLNNRLLIGGRAFENYNIRAWGQPVVMKGFGGTVAPGKTYFFLDSSYLNIMFRFGYMILIAVCAAWVYLSLKEKKKGNLIHLGILVVLAGQCIIEHHLLEIAYNPFLLLLAASDNEPVHSVSQRFSEVRDALKKFGRIVVPAIFAVSLVVTWYFADVKLKDDSIHVLDDSKVIKIDTREDFRGYVDYTECEWLETEASNRIYITGWIAKEGIDSRRVKARLVLKDEENYYVIPTYRSIREDVTEFFGDGVNYDRSGFYSYFDSVAYGFANESGVYEIYMLCTFENYDFLINMNSTLEVD
ncbi:MAG: hypothetical protein J6Z74_03315 [Eubacterium sp.]|nr:hypothetical protein [Eubacterium sp.]